MGGTGPGPSVGELVPLYYAALYRYAYRLSGGAGEAEDLTQDTFCTAHAKRSQLRDPARVKAWLFSILRNAYLHRQRTKKRLKVAPLADLDGFAAAIQETGPDAGTFCVQASSSGLAGSPVLFSFTATPAQGSVGEQPAGP